MKTKILKLLTLVTGLAMGQAFAAGNLFEILPCNSAGETQAAKTATDTPLVAGEKVYFKLRLARTATMVGAGDYWNYTHVGSASDIVDELVHPLKIGIIVSGELRYATYVTNTKATNNLQDFVFEYVTKPGDFALPIRLALKDGNSYIAAGYDQTSPEYVWLNADKWAIRNAAGLDADFTILQTSDADYAGVVLQRPETGARKTDYSLINAGFYVQTVGFGKKWEEVDANNDGVWWRKVHEGSTVTESLTPCLEMDSVAEDAVTLYVWSKDENSVKIFGGETVNMKVDTAGTMKDVQVGTITIAAGQLSANFQIEGVTRDTSTELVLSSFKGYTFNQGANAMVPDFRTVKVKCTEPLPPTLKITADTTEAIAGSARYAYAAQLSVSLSEAYDKDLTVTITPSFSDGAGDDDIGTYMALSRNPSATTKPAATTLTVTIPANSTAPQTAYLYAFRSDARTLDENQIVLTPSVSVDDANKTEAEAWLQAYDTLGLNIVAMQPVITTPSAGAKYGTTCNEEMPVTISVDDTYAAWTDDTTGYEIWFKADDTTNFAKLDGTYINDGGELKKLGAGTKPVLVWGNAGEHESEIYVVSPISKKASDPVKVQVTVGPARTVNLEPTDDLKGVYNEGVDSVSFKITLSEANNLGYPIYAFLMPNTGTSPEQFDPGPNHYILDPTAGNDVQADKQGIVINPATGDATTPVYGSFLPLDGGAKPLGLQAYFSVVLCKTPTYDKSQVVTRYSSVSPMNIKVFNTEPTLNDILFAGFPVSGYTDHAYPYAIPKNQEQTIELVADDMGTYDVTQGLPYRWTAESTTGGRGQGTGVFTTTDTDFTFNFPRAGLWTVKVYLRDKDMGANTYIAPFVFTVNVLDQPQVEIEVAESYSESTAKQSVLVKMPIYDADDYIAVKVTVTPPENTNNPGVFKLDSSYKKGRAPNYPDLTAENEYYVFFTSAGEQQLWVETESLDGTVASETKGFILETEVLGDGSGTNGDYDLVTDPDTGAPILWSKYYLTGRQTLSLMNSAPVCEVPVENTSTNAFEVAGGAATSGWIRFMIRDVTADLDVDPDVAAATNFEGVKVTITGCPAGVTQDLNKGTNVATPMEFFVTENGSFNFIPNFAGVQGDQIVTLMIEDKDGSYQSWTYHYKVMPSKFLRLVSNGPGGLATDLSDRYRNAQGRGAGHAYLTSGGTLDETNSKLFITMWNCSRNAAAQAVAWGYKLNNPTDDGSLDGGQDIAIDERGDFWTAGATHYTYTNANGLDSFLYAWLRHVGSEDGLQSTRIAIAPERVEDAAPAVTPIPLPAEETQDGNYQEVYAEAIFSREWRAQDNCGDINQDGVPDRIARETGLLVLEGENADDLANLAGNNDDEDFLPSNTSSGNDIVPNMRENWAVQGNAFTALREIRGWHDGLNRGYNKLGDPNPTPDYSPNEIRAYLLWKGLAALEALAEPTVNGDLTDAIRDMFNENNNLTAAAEDLANGAWSPERPTNPTLADTDGDGLEDGYEYWFWYGARVGYSSREPDGRLRWNGPMTGLRFNLTTFEMDEIASDEILAEFDPQSPNANVLLNDFDNDGLSNEEEFLIGTNPVRCDTDGDGSIDGFEVMWGLDPVDVRGTEDQNPDGDAMAQLEAALEGETLRTVQFVYNNVRYFFLVNTELFPETPAGQDEADYRSGLPYFWGTLLGYRPDDGTAYNTDLTEVTVDFRGQRIPGPDFGRGLQLQDELVEALQGNRCYGLTKVDLGLLGGWVLGSPEVQYQEPAGQLMLVHDQVYRFLGFDPRTAWCPESPCVHGHVNTRWCGAAHDGGLRVNTVAFTTQDEFYYARYRQLMNQFVETGRGVLADMVANATIPSALTTLQRYGAAPEGEGAADNRTAYGSLVHGADSDMDGVADGWAIYVGGDPLNGYALNNANADRDSLTNVGEFFATDILDEYSDCPSISGLNQNGEDADLGDMDGDGQTSNEEQQIEEARKLAAARRAHVWANKFFPTNPGLEVEGVSVDIYADDTDGDGILDGAEGEDAAFSYSPLTYEEVIADKGTTCFRGGRLNPCSSDTDEDGLPDLWELQYRGTVTQGRGGLRDGFFPEAEDDAEEGAEDGEAAAEIGSWITDGMDGTNGRDATTTDTPDEITGTVRDYDFDGDGLENYQEYLVQAMRVWRYDDAETPLMGAGILWKNNHLDADEDLSDVDVQEGDYTFLYAQGYSTRVPGVFPQMNLASGAAFFQYLVDESDVGRSLNKDGNGFWDSYATGNDYATTYLFAQHMMYDYTALGYLAAPSPLRPWDPTALLNRMIMLPPRAMVALMDNHPLRARTSRVDTAFNYQDEFEVYVSCDPRSRDTDGDGADDFWEIFHGLNPLFGAVDADVNGSDIVAGAYGLAGLTVENNVWMGLTDGAQNVWLDYRRGQGEDITVTYANPDLTAFPDDMKMFDPIRNPWTLGASEADPDGDGLRNIDEGLFGNMTSPYNYHTDPTPLWMTEPETPVSFVSQYYRRGDFAYPETWGTIANQDIGTNEAATQEFLFAFERTEGCDTDGDWSADNQELIRGVLPVSDPLNSADPDRRAALYLGNDDSLMPEEPACVYSYQEGNTPTLRNGAYDLFRHFTVECWVKPERQGAEQTILERAYAYPASNLQNHQEVLRANFRIALDEAGQVYGLFDNNNATESGADLQNSQKVTALGALPLNTWSHVALTFDGTTLRIYVNAGQPKASATTGLIPANGLIALSQDPNSTDAYPAGDYKTVPGGTTIGARRHAENGDVTFDMNLGFEQFTDFFQGYVAEVRLWDGARSEAEIQANYNKRMSQDDIKTNRQMVYEAWYAGGDLEDPWMPNPDRGATRNDNDGKPMLPAQLIALYNFQQLPAAANAADVATVPFGFSKVLKNFVEDDENTADAEDADLNEELFVGWWNDEATPLVNTVYNDYRVIPWVQNMVSRLPLMDGSFGDSMFWSQEYAGYTPAMTHGFNEYGIPNGGNPYKSRNYDFEADLHYWRLVRMAQAGETRAAVLASRFAFEARTQFVGIDELLPFGAAYAKLSPDYWDAGGATTSWVETGVDADGDGLPDWWEANNGGLDTALDTVIDRDGMSIPAWEAYLRDLASGLQPNNGTPTTDPTYASTVDANGDGLVDWWADIYALESGALADDDGDGLLNYTEYLLSEVFKLGRFSPINAYSVNRNLLDYFFKTADGTYVGELYTDHDFMEDDWEDVYGRVNNYAVSSVYDPLDDKDEDGWSNYAEVRSDYWKSAVVDPDLIDRWLDDAEHSYHIATHPEPTLGLRVTYNGIRDVSGSRLVVLAARNGVARPDAKFVVNRPTGDLQGGDNTGVADNELKYIGPISRDMVMHGFLHPGVITPNSVRFEYAEVDLTDNVRWSWGWYEDEANVTNPDYREDWRDHAHRRVGTFDDYRALKAVYEHIELQAGEYEWIYFATGLEEDLRARVASLICVADDANADKVGSVDCRTGEWKLDTTALAKAMTAVDVDLSRCIMRVNYASHIGAEWPQTLYLSDTEEFSFDDPPEARGYGFLREGKNTVMAFLDLDANNEYTAGEPFGVVKDVDVGWWKTNLTPIELTDTSSVLPRFNLTDRSADRMTVLGNFSGMTLVNNDAADGGEQAGDAANGLTRVVRITRQSINDQTDVPERVLLTKTLVTEAVPFIHEGDILRGNKFDLDWQWLTKDAADLGIRNINKVGYRIEEITQSADGLTQETTALATFVNEYLNVRAKGVPCEPIDTAPVRSSSPTFTWTSDDQTMTAFKLQIQDDQQNLIYDSGIQLLPGRTADAYSFTAPISVDAPALTNGAPVLVDNANYQWRVAMLNAKFNTVVDNDAAAWSDWTDFRTAVDCDDGIVTGYGSCSVAVRYYGPSTAATELIIIEAFDTPDFSGQPLAYARLSSADLLSDANDITTTNVTLKGLPPGDIYVRAYIDSNNNGTRETWESWGYVNGVDRGGVRAKYQPVALEVPSLPLPCPSSVLYIEDCDINKNLIMDCLESEDDLLNQRELLGDTDGDGLSDTEEENDYYTSVSQWDTDGDLMPDGWEALYAGTDPLYLDAETDTEDTEADAETGADAEVMAYAEIDGTLVTFDDGTSALLAPGEKTPVVGDAADGYRYTSYYNYGDLIGRGTNITVTAGVGKVSAVSAVTVVLVHAQVYDEFGFNPLTAISHEDAVNTKVFTALDKYLVVRYLEALGLADEAAMNAQGDWAKYTLKPGVIDSDLDGIADGWELYTMFGKTGGALMTDTLALADEAISPWNRDDARTLSPVADSKLTILEEFDGGVDVTDPWKTDTDGDGISDALAYQYHLKGLQGNNDEDNDGLSNYVEYLLTEVFKLGAFSPDSAFSINANLSDYFFKVGESYVGEIFTDHDFIDDRWEDTYRNQDNLVTRHLYDAITDAEEAGLGGDGWSNYAEFQAGTDPLKSASYGIEDDDGNPYVVKEFPVPMVEARIVYNGTQNLNNNPLVVKAWRDETLESQPDATWTIQSAVTAQPDAGAGGDNGNAYEKYLGMNPGKSVVLYLSPGNVRQGSVRISFKDLNYTLHNTQTDEYFYSEPENAEWMNALGDSALSSGKGNIVDRGTDAIVGEIDYQTGALTIDFTKVRETIGQVGIVGQDNNDQTWETLYNAATSYVLIEYEAPALPNFTGAATYYLGEADAPNGGDVNSFGHVKEGRNTFIAFADLDGNGDYTAGEPFGVAPNVDVGWNHTKLQITLTDTSPVTARFSVGGGNNNAGGDNNEGGDDAGGGNGAATNDRDTLYGTEGGNKPIQEITVGELSGGKYERVRVVRTLINGAPAYSKENKTQGVVVLDKMMSLENDSYITEADFLRDGQFDIDWATLADDLKAAGNDSLLVSNVSYRVVLGNGDVSNLVTNNLLGIVFNRWFDSPEVYANEARPQTEALGEVTSASPTFKWTVPGNLNSYSAFQVRVKDADGATIWNSGFQLTPASTLLANGLAQYVWQAPLFAGAKTPDGQYVFANGKKYTYQVSLANARYKNSTNWSDEVAFAMNVLTNTTDTGTMKVAVRYFGPTAVANSGVVRVQAFTTPDFSGQPVGEGFVTDVATLSSTAAVTEANATIIGLPEGNYYLRAFVDTEANGLRAAWESWGYACERDMRDCAIFTPKMIKVGPKSGRQDVITVVIEDCDTDKDSLPDAWEWTQKQNLGDLDVLEADFLADSSLVKKSLAEKLSTSAGGTLSSGLSVQLASLHNPYKAAMVLGVDMSNVTDAESAQAAIVSSASTETVEPKTVAITALDFDTTTGQVTIQVEATTESAAASGITANPIYTVETSATVKVVVQKKTQLTDAAWETIATETLTITGEGPIALTPQAISADTTSGFFRVILEK